MHFPVVIRSGLIMIPGIALAWIGFQWIVGFIYKVGFPFAHQQDLECNNTIPELAIFLYKFKQLSWVESCNKGNKVLNLHFPCSRKLQFNLLFAHREDPFSVCSFGILWNEKCYMLIKQSPNETCSKLTLQLMNLLPRPSAHLPVAESLTQPSDSLSLKET